MVVKVYVSGISGNKEVKKRQQKVLLILDSKKVSYEVLDIAEPNMEEAKEYMQNNSKLMGCTIGDPSPRHPLPPQIFNDDEYCGDYDAFDMANEIDEMEKFLKLAPGEAADPVPQEIHENGDISEKEPSPAKETEEEGEKEAGAGEVLEKVASKEPSPEKEVAEDVVDPSEKAASKEPSPVKETEPDGDVPDKAPSKEPSPAKDAEEETAEPEERVKDKSPSPQKDEATGANETDDQKAENATNGSKEQEAEDEATEDDEEETDKSEQV